MRTTLTFDQCEHVLASQHYGHLGCSDDRKPFVYPVTYVYRNGSLFSHTHEGEKIEILRRNPSVCLQVEHVRSGYDWTSVACHGTFHEITDHDESHEIMLLLADQYAKISLAEKMVPVSPVLEDLHSESISAMHKDIVYRIDIEKTTGIEERPGQ